MAKKGKSITILYFGDCDTKGKVIPYSVLKDIDERIEGIEDERASCCEPGT